MKVLFLTPRPPHAHSFSGDQIVYQRMTKLLARGHEVGLFTLTEPSDSPAWFDDLPKVHAFHRTTLRRPPREGQGQRRPDALITRAYFRSYYQKGIKRELGKVVAEGGYAVVVAEFTAMGQYLHRNPYLPAVRRVLSCHESPTLHNQRVVYKLPLGSPASFFGWLEWQKTRQVESTLQRHADALVCLTPEDKTGLQHLIPDGRIEVVPPGVDLQHFQPADISRAEHALVFTGRLNHPQNLDAMLWFLREVWPAVKAEHPFALLLLAGYQPPPELRRLAQGDEQVELILDPPDVREVLRRAKIFINPMRSGTGMRPKVLEPMAMGLSVVSTRIGAQGLAIHPGVSGFLADTAEEMAATINRVLRDDELRASVAKAARDRVEARFNWKRSADKLEALLADLCQPRHFAVG
jgi:glycosyltransferase involved in cell wall biosynthesis